MEDVLSLYCSAQNCSSLLHFQTHIIFHGLCNANHPYNKLTECIMFRCASVPVWFTVCMFNRSITPFHFNLAFIHICIWEEDTCDNVYQTYTTIHLLIVFTHCMLVVFSKSRLNQSSDTIVRDICDGACSFLLIYWCEMWTVLVGLSVQIWQTYIWRTWFLEGFC